MIEYKNVTITLDRKELIKNFSLHIKPGEKVVLTGPSGVGKSTLLNVLMGFVPSFKGEIKINKTPLRPETLDKLRMQIAWLPQEPQTEAQTVKDWIYFPFTFKKNIHLTPETKEIINLLERFYLSSEILKTPVQDISGGEKQRILLISLLLLKRPILLLDEPTSALDAKSEEAVADYLLAETDTTILSVSHDEKWMNKFERQIKI